MKKMQKKRIPEDQYPKDLQYEKDIYKLYFIVGYFLILYIIFGVLPIAWIITEATFYMPLVPVISLFSVIPLSGLAYIIHFQKERKKFRKEYFKKMQNIENIEKIKELVLEKVEEVKNTQNRDKSITEQREDLNALKDNLNQMKVMNNLKIEQVIEQNTEINRIWNEICHERYIYDVDLKSPLNLTLNKK